MDPRAELIAQRIAEMVADLPASVAEELAGHVQSLGEITGERIRTDQTPPGFPADCQDYVNALISAWRLSGSLFSAQALGLAILSASRAAQVERAGERVELVWSGPAQPGGSLRRTEQALTELVEGARHELWIVSYVAYSVSGIREALLNALRRGVRVCLLLESRESGGDRITRDGITALRSVVDLGAVVYEWPLENRTKNGRGDAGALHAKFALADGAKLLVTSANLTEAAFESNLELGIAVYGGAHPMRLAKAITWMVQSGTIRPVAT